MRVLSLAWILGFSLVAQAANIFIFTPFESGAFQAAQVANKTVVLLFTKADCPGCMQQVPALEGVLRQPAFQSVQVFQVDFVKQSELAARFKVTGQTTFIVYKGQVEKSRSRGVVNAEAIAAELRKGL